MAGARNGRCGGNRDHAIDHPGQKRGLDPGPADPFDARRGWHDDVTAAFGVRGEERGVLRIYNAQALRVPSIADVAAERRAGPSGARTDHDPLWDGVVL